MTRARIRRGPALMLLATALFTLMVAAVKVAREELGALEVILWRTGISVPVAGLLALRGGTTRIHAKALTTLRVLFGFGAMCCFFFATKGLDLGELSVVSRLQPVLVAILAPLALGQRERSSGRLWALLAAGLGGTLLIFVPELDGGPRLRGLLPYAAAALAATTFSACAHVCVRRLGATEDPRALVLWFQLGAFSLAMSVLSVAGEAPTRLPPSHLWLPLAAVGLFATLGQIAMTEAYRTDQASRVAAASYAAPVFGMLGDLVIFGTLPTLWAALGALVVIAAGLALVVDRAPSAQTTPVVSR
ncbi:MAG: DMT family transporter [Myxococcota bacterium]